MNIGFSVRRLKPTLFKAIERHNRRFIKKKCINITAVITCYVVAADSLRHAIFCFNTRKRFYHDGLGEIKG